MSLEIVKPGDKRFCKALVHSPAGSGKTVLLGTAQDDERTSPMLMLDFEGGYESLAGLDIDVAKIRGWDDYNEAFELLEGGDHDYKSVGIDSASETHKFALLNILREAGPSRNDPDLLEQRDYGKATVLMRRLLREFRDLPMHVFYTAHTKEIEIAREGRVRVPDLAGQMAEEISGLMSVVGYLAQFEEDGALHRTLLLHSFPRYRIKARTPWEVEVPEELIDPTITSLLDALGYGESSNGDKPVEMSSRGKQMEEEVQEESPVDPEDQEQPKAPENMTLRELKEHAEEEGISLEGARTKSQILAVVQKHQNASDDDEE